jgi:outer membrane protein
MTSKFLRFVLAGAILFAISALAQPGSSPVSSSPVAPAPSALAPATAAGANAGLKVGTINIQDAIFGSNEGRKEMDGLQKKYDPQQTKLKEQNDELEALKKQLSTQGPNLNEDAAANLKKQIESKQKLFDRAVQDFQEEVGNQQQEVASKILQKMAPIVVKYSQDNGFGLIIDTSKPWPQSPVLWWNQDAVDITKAVIDTYNLQSGVPAPTTSGTAKPPAPKPATGTTPASKPPAPKPTVPQTTTPQTNAPPK